MDGDPRGEFQGLVAGVRAIAAVIVMIGGVIDLGMLSLVGIFSRIYADMFHTKPVPGLTGVIVRFQVPLLLLVGVGFAAFVWAIIRIKNPRYALYLAAAGIALSVVAAVTIGAALFLPLCGFPQGLGQS